MGSCEFISQSQRKSSVRFIKQEYNISISGSTPVGLPQNQENTPSIPFKDESKSTQQSSAQQPVQTLQIILYPSKVGLSEFQGVPDLPRLKQTKSIMVNEEDLSGTVSFGYNDNSVYSPCAPCNFERFPSTQQNAVGWQSKEYPPAPLMSQTGLSDLNNSLALKHTFSNNSQFLQSNHQYLADEPATKNKKISSYCQPDLIIKEQQMEESGRRIPGAAFKSESAGRSDMMRNNTGKKINFQKNRLGKGQMFKAFATEP